jgi:hypothetical protein
MKTPTKVHRSGQIYEYMKPEERKIALNETYVYEDMVTMPDSKTYVVSCAARGLPKPDVIPVLDHSRYGSDSRLIVEMTHPHNGSTVGVGEIHYKDKLWLDGHIIPVLVLKAPLPHPPRVGSEVFQVCGEDESLVSERVTDHLEKAIVAGRKNQWV